MNLRSVLETEDDDWPDPEDEDDVDDEEEDEDDEPEEGTWQVDGSGRSLDFSVMKSL